MNLLLLMCQFSWNILLLKYAVISIIQTTSLVVQGQRFGLNVSSGIVWELVQHGGPRQLAFWEVNMSWGSCAFPRIITSSRSNVLGETKGSAGRSVKSVVGQKQTKGFRNDFSNCVPDEEVRGKITHPILTIKEDLFFIHLCLIQGSLHDKV